MSFEELKSNALYSFRVILYSLRTIFIIVDVVKFSVVVKLCDGHKVVARKIDFLSTVAVDVLCDVINVADVVRSGGNEKLTGNSSVVSGSLLTLIETGFNQNMSDDSFLVQDNVNYVT